MKALIFAAGLGTRLKEHTQNTPKALVKLNGKPMLEHLILKLKSFQITDIVVNIHHYADQIEDFLKKHQNFGCNISISDERDLLLNTGGGLKKVLQNLKPEEDLLVHNVDILTNYDLTRLIKTHQKNKNIATLLTKKRETSRYLLFNENQELKAWINKKNGEIRPELYKNDITGLKELAFSGVHLVNQRALKYFPNEEVFEIIPEYLKIAQKEKIASQEMQCEIWMDLGKPEAITKAEQYLNSPPLKDFISEITEFILEKKEAVDLLKTCIITPNRRAKRLIKKQLLEKSTQGGFIPDIVSIDDFVFRLCPYIKLDEAELLFKLFPIVQEEISPNVDFEEFLNYSSTLLQDFNELDMNLVLGEKVFSYLSEAKAIQQWNPDGTPLSPGQIEYLNFYNKLAPVYSRFREQLAEEGYCYQGMAYRYLAENTDLIHQIKDWDHIILAGFNALTNSEEIILKSLQQFKQAEFIWDADAYYVNDESMEAGLYLRRHSKWAKSIKDQLSHHFLNKTKEVFINGSPGVLGQARMVGQIIQEEKEKDINFFNQTAIIPADENLLLALLHSLPEEILKCSNITMGYPLSYSHSFQLMESVIRMHLSARKLNQLNTSRFRLQKSDLEDILQNPLIRLLYPSHKKDTEIIFQRFLSSDKITAVLQEKELESLDFLFEDKDNNGWAVNQSLLSLFQIIFDRLQSEELKNKYAQELDACNHVLQQLKTLHLLISQLNEPIQLSSYHKLFRQSIQKIKQAFVGQIDEGLQIMGLLESRLMDFKNIILLSTNEDILPSSSFSTSFIPADIKHEFQLPGINEKTAVFAYHFYRLIQRAEKVFLLYSTSKRPLSGGEKSRFIKQLEFELPRYNKSIKINQKILSFNAPTLEMGGPIKIEKDDSIMQQLHYLAEKGLSPTRINTYISCPLKFYLASVAQIKEPEIVEDVINERLFGTVIHNFLEKEYNQFYESDWSVERLKQLRSEIKDKLKIYFKEADFKGNLDEGPNYLDFKNIHHYLDQFLKVEIEGEKKHQGKLKIVALEKELERIIEIQKPPLKVKIKGIADRIDQVNGKTRVLDYKTGKVEAKDLKVTTGKTDKHDFVFSESKYDKLVQLFLYKWMFDANLERDLDIGIISFRSIKSPFIMLETENIRFRELEEDFIALLEEIFNPQIPFIQTQEIKNCEYCIYTQICQK